MTLCNILIVLFWIVSADFWSMLACVGVRKFVHWLWGRRSDGFYGTERFRKQLEEDKDLDGELCLFFLRWILPPWLLILFACFIFFP